MQFFKYIISGVINTTVGYGIFFLFIRIFNVSIVYANAMGYSIALIVAFTLNKVFVFNKSKYNQHSITRFILAFVLSFIANQLILMIFCLAIGLSAEISQIFAMLSYTFTFYFLNKYFVFREKV